MQIREVVMCPSHQEQAKQRKRCVVVREEVLLPSCNIVSIFYCLPACHLTNGCYFFSPSSTLQWRDILQQKSQSLLHFRQPETSSCMLGRKETPFFNFCGYTSMCHIQVSELCQRLRFVDPQKFFKSLKMPALSTP